MNSDPVFVELYNAQTGLSQISSHDMLVLLAKFRRSLSFKWIMSIKESRKELLQQVIITLLQLTEEKNTGVRLAAYSTMGTLILTVAPYSPSTFITAFGDAITSLPVLPKISIAVINSFMSLMRFVSPVRIQSFVENMPILHHFSADISDFIQYLPKTMPMMKKLPPEFQQNILKSLVTACGREPNGHFSISIALLVGHNREILIPDLIKHLKRGDLGVAAVWIGPNLFADKRNFDILDDNGKEFFLLNSFAQLNCEPLNLSHFEYGCKIIAYFMRYSINNPDYLNSLKERLHKSLLGSYQTQFKTVLLSIPNDSIENLIDNPKEADSLRAVRLSALSSYFFDHINDVDADRVAEMMYKLKDSQNDLYSSVIDNLAKCINSMFTLCKKTFHIDLLNSIFSRKNLNWVQDLKVVQLIDAVNIDLCRVQIPDYHMTAIKILLDHTISPTDSLFEFSVEVLKKIASYDTITKILIGIYGNSDWITEDIVYKRFHLLADLAKLFEDQYFTNFIDIAYESLFFCENIKTHSAIFCFLSNIDVKYLPDDVKQFSFDFIEKYYYKYSHCLIDEKNETLHLDQEFMDYDADIVTNPLIDHKTALAHLRHCYEFLCSLPTGLVNDQERLYRYSIAFVTIFDKFALEMAAKLSVGNKKSEEFVWNLSIDTFKTTSNDGVAASCCNIFVNDQRALPDYVEMMIEQFIGERCTANPELLFLCFLNVDQNNHEKVIAAVPTVLSWLSVQNGTVLLFKLIQIVGRDIIPSIKDEYGLALLQYANEFKGKYAEMVRNYIQLTDFSNFPIDEPTLTKNLISFMDDEPKIRLRNPDLLDLKHWKFVFDNVYIFDLSDLSDYINAHRSVFAKVNVQSLQKGIYKNFHVKKVTNSKLPTTTPLIAHYNCFIEEYALIQSFAKFNHKTIPQSLFNRILDYLLTTKNIAAIKDFLRYAILCKKEVDVSDPMFFHPEIIHLTAMIKPEIALKHLNVEKDPCLIVDDSINDTIRLAIVSQDPDYYIRYLISFPKFKKKHYLKIINLLMTVQFSIERLSDLMVKYITIYNEIESESKKQVFTRFLTASLFCLKRRRQTKEYKSFINFLTFHFSALATGTDGALLNEYSHLFALLSIYTVEGKFMVDFLNSVLPIPSSPPLFMISTTAMISKKVIPVSSIDDSIFQIILEYGDLPSFLCSVIRSLTSIDVSAEMRQMILAKFDQMKHNYKDVRYSYLLARAYEDVQPKFLEVFLSDANDPCFNDSLGLASRSSEALPSSSSSVSVAAAAAVVEKVFAANYFSIEIVMAMSEILNKREKKHFMKAVNYFLRFPRCETWEIVEKAAKMRPDLLLKLLFIHLPVKCNQNFYILYAKLRRFYLQSDEQRKEQIQNLICTSADLFATLQARFFALMMLWETDMKTINMGFIVSAIDSNDFHAFANEFENLCKKK